MKLDLLTRIFGPPPQPEPLPRLEPFLTGQAIATALFEGRPFLASRLGWEEATAVWRGRIEGESTPAIRQRLWKHAGVFPDRAEIFDIFVERYLSAIPKIDLLGVMGIPFERDLLEYQSADPILGELSGLEPYFSPSPWSSALEGKRVLVVHPFSQSIQEQYEKKRQLLFADPRILPQFDLSVIAPPQTIAGNTADHSDWSAAFDSLCRQVAAADFEVAILGCGGYGLPLGGFIKDLGKACIHIGGATQILFGIWGARWRGNADFRALSTSAWVSPREGEKPPGADSVEGGCYW